MPLLTSCLPLLAPEVAASVGRNIISQWPVDALVYLIWDQSLPADVLNQLSRHKSAQVRSEVARCADLGENELRRLSRDRAVSVSRIARAHLSVRETTQRYASWRFTLTAEEHECLLEALKMLTNGYTLPPSYLPPLARLALDTQDEALLRLLISASGAAACAGELKNVCEDGRRISAGLAGVLLEECAHLRVDHDLSWCLNGVDDEHAIRAWMLSSPGEAVFTALATKDACPDDVLSDIIERSGGYARGEIAQRVYSHPNCSAATALLCMPYLTQEELGAGHWWSSTDLLHAALSQGTASMVAEVMISKPDMTAEEVDRALDVMLSSNRLSGFSRSMVGSETVRRATEHPAVDAAALHRLVGRSSGGAVSMFIAQHARADEDVRVATTYMNGASPDVITRVSSSRWGDVSWQLARAFADGRSSDEGTAFMQDLADKLSQALLTHPSLVSLVEEFAPRFPGSVDEYMQALVEAAG